jgi:hypothetical protein
MGEDAPPGWIGQRGERAIQSNGRIFNHLVKDLTAIYRDANTKIRLPALRQRAAPPAASPLRLLTAAERALAYWRVPPLSWPPIGLSSQPRVAHDVLV